MALSRLILLRMRNVLNKIVEKMKNTHFVVSNVFPKKKKSRL
jgi:hypothetical protein